jgi:hypothetical protein
LIGIAERDKGGEIKGTGAYTEGDKGREIKGDKGDRCIY